jgi:hypothetical protein
MNYVSCSPFRVPIARLAAAQQLFNTGRRIDPESKEAEIKFSLF